MAKVALRNTLEYFLDGDFAIAGDNRPGVLGFRDLGEVDFSACSLEEELSCSDVPE